MYNSPIKIYENEVLNKICKDLDDHIFAQVQKRIAVDVDRDELIAALNYDRGQYEKGYSDGYKEAQPQWISVEDRLPKVEENPALAVYLGMVFQAWRHPYNDGWEFSNGLRTTRITHWMPLPQPPKGEE